MKTKLATLAAMLALAAMSVGVEAKGCLKGALIGGVGGHVAGHHGVAGAAPGCAAGHLYGQEESGEAAGRTRESGDYHYCTNDAAGGAQKLAQSLDSFSLSAGTTRGLLFFTSVHDARVNPGGISAV
jgi:hypothetical protein